MIGGYASGNWQAWGTASRGDSPNSYRVLAFDNRGIGESDVPDYPYTTLMMARDTIGLMDHLGIERAHFFGKSLGGNIGQWVAIEQPQRVRSLVATSTFAKPDHAPQQHGQLVDGDGAWTPDTKSCFPG